MTAPDFAQGLRHLANLIDAGLVPEGTYPDQPLRVLVLVPDADTVGEFADRMTVPLKVLNAATGRHTSAALLLDGAVELSIAHIKKSRAATHA